MSDENIIDMFLEGRRHILETETPKDLSAADVGDGLVITSKRTLARLTGAHTATATLKSLARRMRSAGVPFAEIAEIIFDGWEIIEESEQELEGLGPNEGVAK